MVLLIRDEPFSGLPSYRAAGGHKLLKKKTELSSVDFPGALQDFEWYLLFDIIVKHYLWRTSI
jgi:hypothetical protein